MAVGLQNIRHAFRAFRQHPGVSIVILLTLALGIGANIAIFSVVQAVLLRPLPYQDSDRLVQIWGQMPSRNIPFHFVPYPDVAEWKAQNGSFAFISAYRPVSLNLTNQGEPRRLSCLAVNADFFPMVGTPMLRGRGFLPEEDRPGAPRVAVMNHPLWQQAFGSDPNIVGRVLNLDGNPCTVVGVLPPGFQFGGNELDLYVPLSAGTTRIPENMSISVGAYARLTPGTSLAAAQSDLRTINSRLDQQFPVRLPRDARVWGVREFMVRNVRLSLWLLMGAAVLVLLIACANIGNILLARSDVRRKEMAIRAALGADRARLVRQILGESVAVSLAGGVLGVFLAWWGVGTLITAASTSYPLLRDASIDLRVLAFGLAISVLSGIVFGCIPALQMSGRGGLSGLWESLKEGITGTSARPQRRRTRSALIVFEVALSLMLLLACGLLLRSFVRLQQVHPGFEARGVLTASITLPQLKYPTGPARVALYQGFLENLRRAPEVEAAGLVDHLPLSNSNAGTSIYPEGGAPERPEDVGIVWMRNMSEDYFRAMSIPLLAGRQFAESDRPPAPPVAIVNRTFARRHWPGEDPLGKRFTIGPPRQGVPVFTVVGVAGDVRHTNLAQEPDAEFFLYYRQAAPSRFTGVFRTRSKDPMQLTNVVRQALASADKDLSISRFTAMDKILSDSTAARRLTMMLLAVFAVLALLLAAVGIYGVISYTVSLRRREIGIRMAMGAPAGRVFRMVAGEAMLLAIIGEAAGLAGILAMRRVLDSQLFGTSPTDPVVFVAVPLLLGAIAFVAAFIPARRAMHVNPLIALRHE